MKTRILTGIIGATMLLAPLSFAQDDKKPSPASPPSRERSADTKSSGMSEDMRQAIEFERGKDRAAARQARIEARRPAGQQNADRTVDDTDQGRKVKDTKAPGAKKDQ
jgi:hypothetical protein